MVSQYPHTVSYTTTSGATKVNGNWTGGTTVTIEKAGRYETNKGQGMITGVDGTKISFDGIVYFPLPQAYLEPGTKVEVKDGSVVLLKGTVKQCTVGQLNARLWL